MPHVSIAPSTTQPTMPNGRKRGCESAMTMKTVARIQYIGTSITDAAFFAHGSLQTTRSEAHARQPAQRRRRQQERRSQLPRGDAEVREVRARPRADQ